MFDFIRIKLKFNTDGMQKVVRSETEDSDTNCNFEYANSRPQLSALPAELWRPHQIVANTKTGSLDEVLDVKLRQKKVRTDVGLIGFRFSNLLQVFFGWLLGSDICSFRILANKISIKRQATSEDCFVRLSVRPL